MADGIIGSVGVSVVPDAENFWRRFEADTRAGGDNAGRRAGADWRRGFDEATRGLRVRPELDDAALRARLAALRAEMDRTMNGGARSGGGLLKAILPLAPALIPVAGAALAAGGALASMGVAGVLALKGIQAEMKAGSALGVQYAAQVKVATTAFSTLQKTAATNFLGGFQGAVSKLNQTLPAFNNTVGSSSKILGDIASHLAGGLAAGFITFQPVILTVERGIDSLAARFEKFASGESGSKFADTLVNDFRQVGKFIGAAATAITHLIVAAAPVGSVLVGAFTDLADAIAAIPTPVLTALVTAISALGTARLISGLGVALAGVGAGAGAAGSGLGAVAVGLSRIVPYVAAAVGLHIAFDTAAKATSDWATGTSDVKAQLHQTFVAMHDLFSLNVKGFFSDAFGAGATQAAKAYGHINALRSSLDLLARSQQSYQRVTVHDRTVSLGSSNGQFDINAVAVKNATATATTATRTYRAAIASLIGVQAQLDQQISKVPLSQVAGQYLTAASAIDKSNESLGKFLKSGSDLGQTYEGVTIRSTAYEAALARTNGDAALAIGIVHGQIDAYNTSADAAAQYAAESEHLSLVIGRAAAKYKLTSDQVDTYSAVLGVNKEQLATGQISQRTFDQAIGGVARAAASAGVSLNNYLTGIAGFNTSTKTAADKAALFGVALHGIVGDTLNNTNLNLQAASAAEGVANAFAKYSDAVSKHGNILGQATKTTHGYVVLQPKLTEGGLAIASALQQQSDAAIAAATSLYQTELRTKGQGQATKDATGLYMGYRDQLKQTLISQGLSADAAQHMTDKYLGVPKNVKTFAKLFGKGDIEGAVSSLTRTLGHFSRIVATAVAKLDRSDVNSGYDDVVSKINGLNGRSVTIPVKYTPVSSTGGVVTNPGGSTLIVGGQTPSARGSRAAFGRSDGKVPPNTVATVGEGASHTWEGLVTDSHGRATIFSNSQAKAMGFRAPIGYASGSGYTPPSLQTSNGGGGSGSGGGSSAGGSAKEVYIVDGHRYASLNAAKNAATSAFKANVKLGISIERKGFSDWKSALKGTVSQARAAFNTILAEAKKLGISDKLASSLSRENKKLDNLVAARNKVRDELGSPPAKPTAYDKLTEALQNLKSEIATVRAAVTGSFDVTTAGANPVSGKISAGGIGAQSKQARTRIKQFYQGIIELGREHLNRDYLQQLAEKGPDALPEVQALVGQKKIIAQLNRDEKSDAYYGQKLGTYIGKKVYGADVNAAQTQVNDLKHRLHTDNVNIQKKLDHLEARFTKAVNHLATRPVQVVAPNGKVLWEYVERGRKESGR